MIKSDLVERSEILKIVPEGQKYPHRRLAETSEGALLPK